MAIGTAAAIAIGAGALIGGVAGAIPKTSSSSNTSGVNLNPDSALQTQSGNTVSQGLTDLTADVNAGPGTQDVANGSQASRDLGDLLKQYQNGGNMPTASDFSMGSNLATRAFAPQQTAMNQNFELQRQQFSQQASMMGRSSLDPVMRNKMNVDQTNQNAMLQSQMGAFGNNFAMNQPGQRLNFASQRANVLGGLASQAMSNRQALVGLGSNIQAGERNYQLATSQHYSNGSTTSGGGVGGALSGALGGAGAGMSMASGMGMMGGGGAFGAGSMGGGGSPSPFSLGVNTNLGYGGGGGGMSNPFSLGVGQ